MTEQYVYCSAHAEVLRRRQDWFEKFDNPYTALWWIPEDHTPSADEAKQRLAHLAANGPSPFVFTLKVTRAPDEAFIVATDWPAFEPCPTG